MSGTGGNRGQILDLITGLRRLGIRVHSFTNRERLRCRVEEPAARESLVCIVAAGGDGTFCDVVNRFPGVPVAILPLGTENLLARYLGISRQGRVVAEMIAQRRTRRIDLGELSGRRFVLMASFGFDAEVVHRVDAQRVGHITKLDYLQPVYQSLRSYEYPELRFWMDDNPRPLTARLGIVANLPAYALGLPVAGSARGDDGLLDVRLFQRGSAFQMVRYLYNVARGRHECLPDVQSIRAARVRVESDRPVPIQMDGDPAGWTPAELRALPGEVEVIVPAGGNVD